MATLQDIVKLLQADPGKAFVLDESGEVKLVIVGIEEYQRLLLDKLKRQVADVEAINRQILRAQLEDESTAAEAPRVDITAMKPARVDMRSEVIDPNFDLGAAMNGEEAEAIRPGFDDI